MTKRKTVSAERAVQARRAKKLIAEIVFQAQRNAFNDALARLAKVHPNGWAGARWFRDEWENSLKYLRRIP